MTARAWKPGKRKYLAKQIKARLRELKVGILDDVLGEVMDANRGYNPDEMAVAYLLILARRQAIGLVGGKAAEFQEMTAKTIGGIVRRAERKTPLAVALAAGRPETEALALPERAAQVLALTVGRAPDGEQDDRLFAMFKDDPIYGSGY